MKHILFLGGSPFQLPPILYAKEQGHYIITCDYLPGNPGHKYADEYHNVSTTDSEAVLALAKKLKIDGIVVFASDASAPTAAFVAEQMGLPGNPLSSVNILTRKDLFRNFLQANNFNVPQHIQVSSLGEAQQAYARWKKPVMVKPVDASGSKGVSKVEEINKLPDAYEQAISFSKAGKVIMEEFIQRVGYQIAGDGFVLDGKLVFRCFAQEHFNTVGNPHVPIGESFPLLLSDAVQSKVDSEIERAMQLLGMKAAELNFDIVINTEGKIFLMEIAPRSGGNLISEVIRFSTGVNLSKYVVDAALGLDCSSLQMYTEAKFYSCYMLHSQVAGTFNDVVISEDIQANIIKQNFFIQAGDEIRRFDNASCAFGELILQFATAEEMLHKMDTMSRYVKVRLMN